MKLMGVLEGEEEDDQAREEKDVVGDVHSSIKKLWSVTNATIFVTSNGNVQC